MAHTHVGIAVKDLENFIDVFCRTVGMNGSSRTLSPKLITIYVPFTLQGAYTVICSKVDVLPLLKLRSSAPGFKFLVQTGRIPGDADWALRTALDANDLAIFASCDNDRWKALIGSKQLSRALIHPRFEGDTVNAELVLHEQLIGRQLDTVIKRCYLTDVRQFGLDEVYGKTSLVFGSRLEEQPNDD